MRIRNYLMLPSGLCFTGEGDGAGGEGNGTEGQQQNGGGFTPPASQADLDRIIESRLARERAKYADYDTLKTEAEQLRALAATDQDKAVAKARQEALDEAQKQAAPRLVRAEFRAAAQGKLSPEQLAELTDDIDLTYSKYLDKDGEPDADKIARKVTAFAPKEDPAKPKRRDLGQGNRRQAGAQPGDQGRAMAEKRFGTKQTA